MTIQFSFALDGSYSSNLEIRAPTFSKLLNYRQLQRDLIVPPAMFKGSHVERDSERMMATKK